MINVVPIEQLKNCIDAFGVIIDVLSKIHSSFASSIAQYTLFFATASVLPCSLHLFEIKEEKYVAVILIYNIRRSIDLSFNRI